MRTRSCTSGVFFLLLAKEGQEGADENSVLHRPRVRPDCVAPFFSPLRRGGRGGLMKSRSFASRAFAPISLRLFFPPLRRGGQGGWSRHRQSLGHRALLFFDVRGPTSSHDTDHTPRARSRTTPMRTAGLMKPRSIAVRAAEPTISGGHAAWTPMPGEIMADENLFLEHQHPASRRLAVLEDDGTSVWLYLTEPDSRRPAADAWVYR